MHRGQAGRVSLCLALESCTYLKVNREGGCDSYPPEMQQNDHHTLVYLPRDIALALASEPSLVAEAIGAFYEREPEGLRVSSWNMSHALRYSVADCPTGTRRLIMQACNKMLRFPPASPLSAFIPVPSSSDLPDANTTLPPTVFTLTHLTKTLYSQLLLQKFFPPKIFEKVNWLTDSSAATGGAVSAGGVEERRRSLGMKIVRLSL